MKRSYIVIKLVDITADMIEESLHTGDTFRKSLDGEYGILKFNSPYLNSCQGLTKLSRDQVLELMKVDNDNWNVVDEELTN